MYTNIIDYRQGRFQIIDTVITTVIMFEMNNKNRSTENKLITDIIIEC